MSGTKTLSGIFLGWKTHLKSGPHLPVAARTWKEEVLDVFLLALALAGKFVPSLLLEPSLESLNVLKTS